MNILLIRHGPTDWNKDGRLQGRADRCLSSDAQTRIVQWHLPDWTGQAVWWSSPLMRARQTAATLTHKPVQTDDRLVELDWGQWEGQRLRIIRQNERQRLAAMEARGLDFAPPRGESYRQVRQRLARWMKDCDVDRHHAAVTHRGVMLAALSLASNWDMRSDMPVMLTKSSGLLMIRRGAEIAEVQAIEL